MGWADNYIKQLQSGKSVSFRPRGNSMDPLIKSGQLVTLIPVTDKIKLVVGDIVLCRVKGRQYLHLIKGIRGSGLISSYQIGNNRGFVNGWTHRPQVYGVLSAIEMTGGGEIAGHKMPEKFLCPIVRETKFKVGQEAVIKAGADSGINKFNGVQVVITRVNSIILEDTVHYGPIKYSVKGKTLDIGRMIAFEEDLEPLNAN